MVKEIILNDTVINVKQYEEESIHERYHISIVFDVTSEDYHDITTLLYKGTFHVKVPETDRDFIGKIQEYSTSVTNLYEKGNIGEFRLRLTEVTSEEGRACH